MMNLQHRVQINIADRSGQKKQVLDSKKVHLPQRLLNLIFGDFCEVLVLTPGTSVRNIDQAGRIHLQSDRKRGAEWLRKRSP